MRGLRLTAAQAQRLFGLREDIFLRVFNALVDAAILRRDVKNGYARNDRASRGSCGSRWRECRRVRHA